MDGIIYSGTIDTSFMYLNNPTYSNPDTVVICTGTSYDKKANIHIRLLINRSSIPVGYYTSKAYNAGLVFDTSSTNFLVATSAYPTVNLTYSIDTITSKQLKASFTGTLAGPGLTIHNITGKFNCEYGKGDSEPKAFSFNGGNLLYAGYIQQSTFNSNTLTLDGLPYYTSGGERFKLLIHTGASIKPGVYESSKKQVGFSFYMPSLFRYYVDDSVGNLKVTISSVNGNIVSGFFEGTNFIYGLPSYNGLSISNGKFTCRLKNYQPYIDSVNKWKYIEEDMVYQNNPFMIYGGNILNATRSFKTNRYYLTINGESDNLNSKFKLVIASNSAIDTGNYTTNYFGYPLLDTLYITSGSTILANFNGGSNNVSCHIDTINSNKVVGKFGQVIVGNPGRIRQGNFRANF